MRSQNANANTADRSPSGDALVAAGLIAAGTLGYAAPSLATAEPVRFDTDADIRSMLEYAPADIGPDTRGASIDLTKSFDNQAPFDPTDQDLLQLRLLTYSGAGSFFVRSYSGYQFNQPGSLGLTNYAVSSGDSIDGTLEFGSLPFNAVTFEEISSSDGGPNRFDSIFIGGDAMSYVGVQFFIDGAAHYGWLGFEVTPRTLNDGVEALRVSLVAWGYETEAGVAIAAGVPGPASLGVLAIGAAGALGRRKRAA